VLSNLFFDTFNTLAAIYAITSSSPVVAGGFIETLGWKQWAGAGLFVTGILTETLAEESRKRFKANPSNKGKIDDTGLWSIVRHPNYAGFTLLRSGASLATVNFFFFCVVVFVTNFPYQGSLGYSIGMCIFSISFFIFHAIPELSGHMSEHYGEQWTSYKKRVPYKLFPGIV
jgi:steroid 5-alpha reductase family enzyme